jgi:hypothetical protein
VFQQSCSSSRVPAVVFQQSCSSSRVSAFVSSSRVSVFQQSCSSSRVPASCSSSRVPAVVFQLRVPAVVFQLSCSSFVFQQSCSSICDSANICVRTCVAASVYSFVLQHLCSCFSNCVPASAIVFQLLCSNTCACSITNRLSSMTTLSICVSFCVPALFQHCVSASVFAFVLQQFAFVLQHLCCSFCVPASVLHTQSIAINDNLDNLR